jgi:hypothetical protein
MNKRKTPPIFSTSFSNDAKGESRKQEIGRVIKKRMEELGLNSTKLKEMIRSNSSGLDKLLTGEGSIQSDNFVNLLEVLGLRISPDDDQASFYKCYHEAQKAGLSDDEIKAEGFHKAYRKKVKETDFIVPARGIHQLDMTSPEYWKNFKSKN